MVWFPDSVHCTGCGVPLLEGGAERCSACSEAPKRWTADDERRLLELRAEGLSCSQVAARMGLTRNAIIGKLDRIKARHRPAKELLAYWDDCYWPADRMKEIVSNTLGDDEFCADDETHRAGLFLWGSALVGARVLWVAEATGLRPPECYRFKRQARNAAIIARDKIDVEPWAVDDPPTATINFVLDCMVTAGILRVWGGRGEDRRYGLASWKLAEIAASCSASFARGRSLAT